VKLSAAVWSASGIDPKDKLVLLRLADRVNGEEFDAYLAGKRPLPGTAPGLRSLAADCAMSRNGVSSAIGRLKQRGFLQVEPSKKKDLPSQYFLQPAALEAAAPAGGSNVVSHVVAHRTEPREGEAAPARGSNQPDLVAQISGSGGSQLVSQNRRDRIEPEVLRAAVSEQPAKKEDAADEVLRLYGASYERKVGEPYTFHSKAHQQAADLLKTTSLARVRKVIAAFFDFADQWNCDNGYPFGTFCRQFPQHAAKTDRAANDEPDPTPYRGVDATNELLRSYKAVGRNGGCRPN
jgi:hypothetical protein